MQLDLLYALDSEMIAEMRDQFRTLLASIGFVAPTGRGGRGGGGYGIAMASGRGQQQPQGPPRLAEGTRVSALFYGDGTWNPGVIRGECAPAKGKGGGAGGNYLVEFEGYEEDGTQETLPRDLRPLQAATQATPPGAGAVMLPGGGEVAASGKDAKDSKDPYGAQVPLLKARTLRPLKTPVLCRSSSQRPPFCMQRLRVLPRCTPPAQSWAWRGAPGRDHSRTVPKHHRG